MLQVGSTLHRQWPSLEPVFEDQAEKALKKIISPCDNCFQSSVIQQLGPYGQDNISASVSVMLLTPVNPSRIQIQNGASTLSALSTRKLGSWPMTLTLPALFCALLLCLSLASVFLVLPVAHGYQGILCTETCPHPFGI